MWSVPQRLKTLAEVEVRQGRYADADDAYDRASAFVDSLVGNYSSVLAKTAVITASSEIYTEHFSLVAKQLHQLPKAYSICLLYTSPSPRDRQKSRMPSSA